MIKTLLPGRTGWRCLRRGALVWLAALGLTLAQGQTPPARRGLRPPAHAPNIILILADDLGYGDLGCYGQKRIRTPNLDRLAAEGMRFTQCYAGSTVCAPSRCALMTGLDTGHCRIRGNAPVPLRPEDMTVAEVLQQAGYTTAAVGKWGLGLETTSGAPNQKGFEEWFGYLDQTRAHNYYPDFLWRNERKFYLFGNANGGRRDYAPDWFIRAATNIVREDARLPFFLYLAYTIPHANNERFRQTGNGMEVPTDAPYTAVPWPQPEKNKAAMITRMDRDIGKLLAELEALRLASNTVVFFSSDNGPHAEGGNDPKFFDSAGPLRGVKRDLYEGGIRVPMIVRWPGKIKPGTVSDQVWAFWDFLPTAAEIAGIQPPSAIDGVSMLPALLGRPQRNHPFLYWEFHERGFQQAVRMGDWKAVRLGPDQPLALYNLKTDPGERENVAGRHPEILGPIETYLKTARTDSPYWPVKPKAAGQDRRP